jgi:hypothetical protein
LKQQIFAIIADPFSKAKAQLDAVHEEDRDGRLVFTQVREEDVLNALGLFAHDGAPMFSESI